MGLASPPSFWPLPDFPGQHLAAAPRSSLGPPTVRSLMQVVLIALLKAGRFGQWFHNTSKREMEILIQANLRIITWETVSQRVLRTISEVKRKTSTYAALLKGVCVCLCV